MSIYVPDRIWIDRSSYLEAESKFLTGQGKKARDGSSVLTKQSKSTTTSTTITSKETINQHQENPFISEINKVRHFIQNSLNSTSSSGDVKSSASTQALEQRLASLEIKLEKVYNDLAKRIAELEVVYSASAVTKCPVASAPKKAPASAPVDDDDDDLDLFGDDDTPKKPVVAPVKVEKKKKEVIAKSSVVLDVKPWDDETDMKKLEECVRSIEKDGLLWGSSKLVTVAYNLKKLQIVCVVEDDKVGIEELSEEIEAFEDYVQSVDVAAFNKI